MKTATPILSHTFLSHPIIHWTLVPTVGLLSISLFPPLFTSSPISYHLSPSSHFVTSLKSIRDIWASSMTSSVTHAKISKIQWMHWDIPSRLAGFIISYSKNLSRQEDSTSSAEIWSQHLSPLHQSLKMVSFSSTKTVTFEFQTLVQMAELLI